jgi:hypothetical protein
MKQLFLFILISFYFYNNSIAQKDTIKPGEVVFYPASKPAIQKLKVDTVRWKAKNIVFLELLGNSCALGSLNYERSVNIKNVNGMLGFRMGFFYIGNKDDVYNSLVTMITFLNRKARKNHLELGIGQTLRLTPQYTSYYDGVYHSTEKLKNAMGLTLSTGYRYQDPNGGVFFQCAYTPTLFFGHVKTSFGFSDFFYIIDVGLGLGYSF